MNLNPLEQIKPLTILATVGVFSATYLVLRRTVFLPLVNVMEDRRERVDEGREAGYEARRELEAAVRAAEARLAQAHIEADGVLQASREHAEREREKRIAQAQAEAQHVLDGGRATIMSARDAEIATLRAEALDCVSLACEKLAVPLDPMTAGTIVDAVIAKRIH